MSALPAALARPRAILFDWDNTLVDSWAILHEALNVALAAMGRPSWSLAETRGQMGRSLKEFLPLHFGEHWEEARRLYHDAFARIHLERLAALPGRAELLGSLAEAGIFLGVVSNKTGAFLRREAERLGWLSLFGSLVGAGDAPQDKPDAAPVRLALRPTGSEAGDGVWLVGDSELDMECAINSGCLPVLLGTDAAPFASFPPRLSFSEGAALVRFVEGL